MKGNGRLIGWDFGKEITLTLEDAVFSPKSMAIMFGNGTVGKTINGNNTLVKTIQRKMGADKVLTTEWVDANGEKKTPAAADIVGVYAADSTLLLDSAYNKETAGKITITDSTAKEGDSYFIKFNVEVTGSEIVVGPDTFPGTLAA